VFENQLFDQGLSTDLREVSKQALERKKGFSRDPEFKPTLALPCHNPTPTAFGHALRWRFGIGATGSTTAPFHWGKGIYGGGVVCVDAHGCDPTALKLVLA